MVPLQNLDAGIDISTSPLAPASELLKKGLLGKYILLILSTQNLSTRPFALVTAGSRLTRLVHSDRSLGALVASRVLTPFMQGAVKNHTDIR